jgi:MerR family transcriptional regulator, light-induced transcriptional regulator
LPLSGYDKEAKVLPAMTCLLADARWACESDLAGKCRRRIRRNELPKRAASDWSRELPLQGNDLMSQQLLVERLFESLIAGDRAASRKIVGEAIQQGANAQRILTDLFWPTHEMIEKLHRQDHLTIVAYQTSTRLLRMMVDQTAGALSFSPAMGKTVFACCGNTQGEELAGQMASDLLEAAGYEVVFAGGSLPADEILNQVQERRPDFLVMFASSATDLPGVRTIVDSLREINAVPNTKIAVGGGVFNRAEGLAEEIGIDLCAKTPLELVELLAMGEFEQREIRPVATIGQPVKKKAVRKVA